VRKKRPRLRRKLSLSSLEATAEEMTLPRIKFAG